MDLGKATKIMENYKNKNGQLINILQDIQSEYNFLPKDVLAQISERFKIPLSKIYSVATFYTAFSLKPRGKHIINVCLGTACFVKGARLIIEAIERKLNIGIGETTKDLKFSLEAVRCLGCCGLAPVVKIDNKIYGHMSPDKLSKILNKYR